MLLLNRTHQGLSNTSTRPSLNANCDGQSWCVCVGHVEGHGIFFQLFSAPSKSISVLPYHPSSYFFNGFLFPSTSFSHFPPPHPIFSSARLDLDPERWRTRHTTGRSSHSHRRCHQSGNGDGDYDDGAFFEPTDLIY